eukprot:NODE_26_length_40862_cov_0.679513.p29 type:complete len:101 gc:universal NODE_26_length_40862_cov_0.679513:16102-15800(-)
MDDNTLCGQNDKLYLLHTQRYVNLFHFSLSKYVAYNHQQNLQSYLEQSCCKAHSLVSLMILPNHMIQDRNNQYIFYTNLLWVDCLVCNELSTKNQQCCRN